MLPIPGDARRSTYELIRTPPRHRPQDQIQRQRPRHHINDPTMSGVLGPGHRGRCRGPGGDARVPARDNPACGPATPRPSQTTPPPRRGNHRGGVIPRATPAHRNRKAPPQLRRPPGEQHMPGVVVTPPTLAHHITTIVALTVNHGCPDPREDSPAVRRSSPWPTGPGGWQRRAAAEAPARTMHRAERRGGHGDKHRRMRPHRVGHRVASTAHPGGDQLPGVGGIQVRA